MPVRFLPVLALSTVLLAGCSSGTETVADDPVVQVPSAAPSAAAVPSVAPSVAPSPSPSVRVIAAEYRGGEVVVDSSRVETKVGEQVVLRFTSDVVEEVHVHGYDEYVDLAPGAPVELPLTLTLPGSYEVELHGTGQLLYQLRTAA